MTSAGQGYLISIKNHIDHRWLADVSGAQLSHRPDGTSSVLLAGIDQAGLMSLLRRLHDGGMEVLGVECLSAFTRR
ncbi:MAG: hypothetical protein RJQ10_07890 [Haliea sp.]|uniref:hypothetical protein n=1 Tax=Haliea sp. TaxID=1932666 RepID=UPI0032EE9516